MVKRNTEKRLEKYFRARLQSSLLKLLINGTRSCRESGKPVVWERRVVGGGISQECRDGNGRGGLRRKMGGLLPPSEGTEGGSVRLAGGGQCRRHSQGDWQLSEN